MIDPIIKAITGQYQSRAASPHTVLNLIGLPPPKHLRFADTAWPVIHRRGGFASWDGELSPAERQHQIGKGFRYPTERCPGTDLEFWLRSKDFEPIARTSRRAASNMPHAR